MRKKNLRIKKSRHRKSLTQSILFTRKEAEAVYIKDHFLQIAFPNHDQRQAYITALIKGFDVEPIIPETQFTR